MHSSVARRCASCATSDDPAASSSLPSSSTLYSLARATQGCVRLVWVPALRQMAWIDLDQMVWIR